MAVHELNPVSQAVVDKINSRFAPNDVSVSGDQYGHAMQNLARGLAAGADVFDEDRQKKHLRDSVMELIDKFGPRIIPLLKDELQGVLTPEEIEKYCK